MGKYIIDEIISDGYERYVSVQSDKGGKLVAHFLEYNEYLSNYDISKIKQKGSVIEGFLSIDLVSKSRKCNADIMHMQDINNSSHMMAVVKITGVIDDYSAYAMTDIDDETVLIEFEDRIKYQVNDIVCVEGSLEIHEYDAQEIVMELE